MAAPLTSCGDKVARHRMSEKEEDEEREKSGLRKIWETVPRRSRSEEQQDLERWIESVEKSEE